MCRRLRGSMSSITVPQGLRTWARLFRPSGWRDGKNERGGGIRTHVGGAWDARGIEIPARFTQVVCPLLEEFPQLLSLRSLQPSCHRRRHARACLSVQKIFRIASLPISFAPFGA